MARTRREPVCVRASLRHLALLNCRSVTSVNQASIAPGLSGSAAGREAGRRAAARRPSLVRPAGIEAGRRGAGCGGLRRARRQAAPSTSRVSSRTPRACPASGNPKRAANAALLSSTAPSAAARQTAVGSSSNTARSVTLPAWGTPVSALQALVAASCGSCRASARRWSGCRSTGAAPRGSAVLLGLGDGREAGGLREQVAGAAPRRRRSPPRRWHLAGRGEVAWSEVAACSWRSTASASRPSSSRMLPGKRTARAPRVQLARGPGHLAADRLGRARDAGGRPAAGCRRAARAAAGGGCGASAAGSRGPCGTGRRRWPSRGRGWWRRRAGRPRSGARPRRGAWYSRSCSSRSSLIWLSMPRSPISSRNSVPRAARRIMPGPARRWHP